MHIVRFTYAAIESSCLFSYANNIFRASKPLAPLFSFAAFCTSNSSFCKHSWRIWRKARTGDRGSFPSLIPLNSTISVLIISVSSVVPTLSRNHAIFIDLPLYSRTASFLNVSPSITCCKTGLFDSSPLVYLNRKLANSCLLENRYPCIEWDPRYESLRNRAKDSL